METIISLVISSLALAVSFYSLYRQSIRVIGPIITLLNEENSVQRTVVMPSYSRLPEIFQQEFPEYIENYPGYAEFRLNYANVGDRAGIIEIKKIEIKTPPNSSINDYIKASYYDYKLIPPNEMKDQVIILRNIPVTDHEKVIKIRVKILCGGAHPKNGKYQQKEIIERTLKVLLVPGESNDKVI